MINMSDSEDRTSSTHSRSQADRIQEEVNRLLPDISFDDLDDGDPSNEIDVEAIEIFSRDSYLNGLSGYGGQEIDGFYETGTYSDDEVTGEKGTDESIATSLMMDRSNDVTCDIFDEITQESSGSSMEALMKAALRQLAASSETHTSSINAENETVHVNDGVIHSNTQEECIRRVSFDEPQNSVQSFDDESKFHDTNAIKSSQSETGRLFGGLSANKHNEARRRYLPEGNLSLNFGVRGDVDLDDVLNDMDTPVVDISNFYDAELDDKEERNIALLKKLESMSRQYEEFGKAGATSTTPLSLQDTRAPTQASSFLPLQQPTSESTTLRSTSNGTSSKVDFCDSTDDVHKRVYLNFVPQNRRLMNTNSHNSVASTNNVGSSTNDATVRKLEDYDFWIGHGNRSETVFLDLRHSMPNSNSTDLKSMVTLTPSDSETEESSDEGEEGLWLDRYRQARSSRPISQDLGSRGSEISTKLEEKSEVKSQEEVSTIDKSRSPSPTLVIVTSTNAESKEQEVISDTVKRKIEEIKKREEELRVRRRWGHMLTDIIEQTAPESELVFHEDFSFKPPIPLFPSEIPAQRFTLKFELRAPGEIVTSGKRSKPLDDGRGIPVSHAALLTWLVSLVGATYPFRVIGLQQCVRSHRLFTFVSVVSKHGSSHIQSFLSDNTLQDALPSNWLSQIGDTKSISNLKLSNFVSLSTNDGWLQTGCFSIFQLPSADRVSGWQCENSAESGVVILNSQTIGHGGRILSLLLAAQRDGLDLMGVRLLHPSNASPILALAWHGHNALHCLRDICGPGPRAVLTGAPGWELTRFPESVPVSLARYFGERIPSSSPPNMDIARTLLKDQQYLLARAEVSDILLLLSPAIPDIGWLLHAAQSRGLSLVGLRRVCVNVKCAEEELGMSKAQTDVYTSGVSHLFVLRQENAMGHAASFVEYAYENLRGGQLDKLTMPHSGLLFYAMPCLPSLLSCFGSATLYEFPSIFDHQLQQLDNHRFTDEQYVFTCIHGSRIRQMLSELLDQSTDFEVLGLKCSPQLSVQHQKLLEDSFRTKIIIEFGIVCVLLRGINIIKRLQEAKKHAHGSILMSCNLQLSVRLSRSFFFEWELLPDPRRRQLRTMLPQLFFQHEKSVFKSMVTPLPEMKSFLRVELSHDVDKAWAIGKVWKTLENENFKIEAIYFSNIEYLWITVERINAVYQLVQCVDAKIALFLRTSKLTYPSSVDESESELAATNHIQILTKMHMVSESQSHIDTTANGQFQEFGIILVTSSALNYSERSKSVMTHLFELVANKKFSILRCQTFYLKEEAAQQISNFGIIALDETTDVSITTGKCICLLFQGVTACIGIGQMLKSNQTLQSMGKSILITHNEADVLRISSLLFGFSPEN